MSHKQNFKKGIIFFYLRSFFSNSVFFWAVDKLFFEQCNVTPSQIALLLNFWIAMVLVFKLPSGLLADKISRKLLLIVSSIFDVAALIAFLKIQNLNGFFLGYLFWSIADIFKSGIQEAYFFDLLKTNKNEELYAKFSGTVWAVSSLGFFISAISAGFLANLFSFDFVIMLSILTTSLSVLSTLFLPNIKIISNTENLIFFKKIGNVIKAIKKTPLLFNAIVFGATIQAAYGYLDEIDQIYISHLGLPVSFLSIWWFARILPSIIGSKFAHKFKSITPQIIDLLAILNIIIIIFISFVHSILLLPLFALSFSFFAICIILNETIIQNSTNSKNRATTLTFGIVVMSLSQIIVGFIYGFLANATNAKSAIGIFGVLAFLYFVLRKTENKNNRL